MRGSVLPLQQSKSKTAVLSYACELIIREEGRGQGGVHIGWNYALHSVSGFTGPSRVVTVNVTTADGDDDVALECLVGESNPPLKSGSSEMETLSQRSHLTIGYVSSTTVGTF